MAMITESTWMQQGYMFATDRIGRDWQVCREWIERYWNWGSWESVRLLFRDTPALGWKKALVTTDWTVLMVQDDTEWPITNTMDQFLPPIGTTFYVKLEYR